MFLYILFKSYCPDKYKTQKLCEKAVDDCLAASKFILDWFVTSKMFKKLDHVLRANDDILFNNKVFDKVTFIANQKHIFAVDLEKKILIILFMKMILIPLFISDFWLGLINLKHAKHLKKISEELMPIAWNPKRWWNFCMLEVEKKQTEPIFTE